MARPDDRLDKPGAPGYRLTTLTAYVAVDPKDDSEGIVGGTVPGLGTTPLIGADDARVMQLRPIAEKTARLTGRPVKLVRFTGREDIETINP
jgi:hypothetical protein